MTAWLKKCDWKSVTAWLKMYENETKKCENSVTKKRDSATKKSDSVTKKNVTKKVWQRDLKVLQWDKKYEKVWQKKCGKKCGGVTKW